MKITFHELPQRQASELTLPLPRRAGLVVVDAESGKILSTNRPVLELLGLAPLQILGVKIWEVPQFQEFTRSESFFRQRSKVDVRAPVVFSLTCGHGFRREIHVVSQRCARDGNTLLFFTLREAAASDLRRCA